MTISLLSRLVDRVALAIITLLDGPEAFQSPTQDPLAADPQGLPNEMPCSAAPAAAPPHPLSMLGMDHRDAEAFLRKARQALAEIGGNRTFLPMSSGVNILPNTSAQITSRPQNCAFRAERIIIHNAKNWVINDIRIGNQSQFLQSGDIPGVAFDARGNGLELKLDICQAQMDFVILATYLGDEEEGEPFVCCAIGTKQDPL